MKEKKRFVLNIHEISKPELFQSCLLLASSSGLGVGPTANHFYMHHLQCAKFTGGIFLL